MIKSLGKDEYTHSSMLGNLIPFPSRRSETYTLSTDIFGLGQIADINQLKQVIERAVFSALVNMDTMNMNYSNPFDAIYIAELKPDKVYEFSFSNVIRNSEKIVDLSSTIQFNDGWDD